MARLRLQRAAHRAESHPDTVPVPLPTVKKWIAEDTNGVNQVVYLRKHITKICLRVFMSK